MSVSKFGYVGRLGLDTWVSLEMKGKSVKVISTKFFSSIGWQAGVAACAMQPGADRPPRDNLQYSSERRLQARQFNVKQRTYINI